MGSISLVKVEFREGSVYNTSSYSDDGQRLEVAKILIYYSSYSVEAIQFSYAENGQFVLGQKHGTACSDNFKVISLDYPSEVIKGIHGTYDCTKITSISFVTNKSKYGPFGTRKVYDTSFKVHWGGSECFGGFHGTVDDGKLYSIGVFIKQAIAQRNQIKN